MINIQPGVTKVSFFVANRKGGVRKTWTSMMLSEYLANEGVPIARIQVDNATWLDALYPGQVTTIDMPSQQSMREDDLADARALAPAFEILTRADTTAPIVDIGANYDGRCFDFFAAMKLSADFKDRERIAVGLVPITSDPKSQVAGAQTARRFVAAFPDGVLIIVLGEDGVDVLQNRRTEIRDVFDRELGGSRTFDQLELIRHPRLLPGALAILESTGMSPPKFALTQPGDLVRSTGCEPAVVRQVASDVTIYIAKLFADCGRALPCVTA